MNRQFLHPLGLALEIIIDDETGEKSLSGIWDFRDDPEGIYFDYRNSSQERITKAKAKKENVEKQFEEKRDNRVQQLGFFIEPVE